jgi:hypothetical protein
LLFFRFFWEAVAVLGKNLIKAKNHFGLKEVGNCHNQTIRETDRCSLREKLCKCSLANVNSRFNEDDCTGGKQVIAYFFTLFFADLFADDIEGLGKISPGNRTGDSIGRNVTLSASAC